VARQRERWKPAHVWAWLWTGWAVTALAMPAWVPALGAISILGFYALVCYVLPTYDCPKCRGRDRSTGWLVTLLASMVGGHRAGCRSKRCHGGERVRWGVVLAQPTRAQWHADNPGRPEQERPGR